MYAQCPNGTPPPGCNNWIGPTMVSPPIPILMDDGAICTLGVVACKRCCNGVLEYYIYRTLWYDDDCRTTHGIDLNSPSFHSQIATALLNTFSLCPGSEIPLCPDKSNVIALISYAPCYRWGSTVYNPVTGKSERELVACTNEVGCSESYQVCYNDVTQKFEWTYIGQSYSAVCPTGPSYIGCFGICRNP